MRDIPGGDVTKEPQANLGKWVASPIKKKLLRAKRARHRESGKSLMDLMSASPDVTMQLEEDPEGEQTENERPNVQSTVVGEQPCADYQVYELPSDSGDVLSDSFSTSASGILSDISSYVDSASTLVLSAGPSNTEVLVNKALLDRIESLELQNHLLKSNQAKSSTKLCLDQIKNDDKLFNFYTGFVSYEIFLAFFEFLGPAANELITGDQSNVNIKGIMIVS